MTNADHIRGICDAKLAEFINKLFAGEIDENWCKCLKECDEEIEAGVMIPLERCTGCIVKWLRQPYKGGEDDGQAD